jgi:hypothetical protein
VLLNKNIICKIIAIMSRSGGYVHATAAEDSPRHRYARHPSLRFAHRGDRKFCFSSSTLFAASAGERVVQRSVDRVSRSQRFNEAAYQIASAQSNLVDAHIRSVQLRDCHATLAMTWSIFIFLLLKN